jgi:UDP-hydrolysing UDP-N-acetyl-D-glucosamine 2-epimerase
LQVIVSGTHLSKAHGETQNEIELDGFPIDARVDMALCADDVEGVASSAALALKGTAQALMRLSPDILVLLGDRYELLAAANAAVLAGVPIAHIHGGEITEGAIDEVIRHAITKLAHYHFPAAEIYADRIRQMGEASDRVWNVGAPAMDNIAALIPIPRSELEAFLGIPIRSPSLLITYHPVTLELDKGLATIHAMLDAVDAIASTVIITGTNADPGANPIRKALQTFADGNPERVVLIESLGARRYLSLMHYVDVVVGNSSSGILEAPAVGVPTVDIGQRQQGRLRAPSVIHCVEEPAEIRRALEKATSAAHRAIAANCVTPYGKPGASRRIVDVLESVTLSTKTKAFIDRRCHTHEEC